VTAGNAALRPQFTREQEFGLDIIGIDNRVSLELVYARQTSRDQIIALPVPVITGFNSILGNGAEVKGHTYEATLQARVVNRPNTTWQISLVADRSRNEITEWGRACFYGSNAGRGHEFTCAGASAGDFWIQTHLRDAADLPTAVKDRASEFQINDEGYLVWVGAGNDYTEGVSKSLWGTSMAAGGRTFYWGEPIVLMDDNNIAILPYRGTSLADLNYGFTSNIRYKNLTLYGVLRGQLGGKVYSNSRQYLYNQLRHGDLDQTGKPEGLKKPVDYYQRALYNGNNWTDVFLEDATHLKVSEISLRYRFTRNQLQKVMGTIAPADLSIGVNGRNLFTFTGYRGFDPERGTQLSRVEGIGYPHLRNFTATLDITF
jgi:hypothetical protein